MSYKEEKLQFQHLAGGDIIREPPLFSPDGAYLFILKQHAIHLYSTTTGELHRILSADDDKDNSLLISMEFELNDKDLLVTCSSTGKVQRWLWRTGQKLKQGVQLKLIRGQKIRSCNLLNRYNNSEYACAFVTYKRQGWAVFDTSNGSLQNVRCTLTLYGTVDIVIANTTNHKYVAVIKDFYIYFINYNNYNNWQWLRLRNAHNEPITSACFHPHELAVATGDVKGCVFIWRDFDGVCSNVKTTLYHWHHTAITSIAFSATGASFYSSGLEAVLVKWNVARPNIRSYVPRMFAIIRHVAVSANNMHVAVCTTDNAIQFLGNDDKQKHTLQEFTYIIDDKTGLSKFPVGLRYNPRSNTLVLNGRIGHLQFYSPYTKQLLYNLDITMENALSWETEKVLYNIRITKAAFNVDWMATGEEFNDTEHFPELRLKFWHFNEEQQRYALVSCIELPHEGGFRAIEFSSPNHVDNLLCATAGIDNRIKIWSLDDSDNIYHEGMKIWYCIAQCSYKNLPIYSMSFSPDGSVLTAGFGNTLCVYKAETLTQLAALTAPPGWDGQIAKIQLHMPRKESKKTSKSQADRSALLEKHKRSMQHFVNFLEKNDNTFIKELQQDADEEDDSESTQHNSDISLPQLNEEQQQEIYEKVMRMPMLNLFHKLLVFQRLGIRCKVNEEVQSKMINYLRQTIAPANFQQKIQGLHDNLHRLHASERFKFKNRLQQMSRRKRIYDERVTKNLVPLMSLLNLSETAKEHLPNGNAMNVNEQQPADAEATNIEELLQLEELQTTSQSMAQITNVQFASGDNAHLVLISTQFRILIWNLLNLRISSVLKLSVEHMAFDEISNLVAVVNRNKELYIFQVNVPIPIYVHPNMPDLHGMIWLARRYPKQSCIEVDWQAKSTLYFLTANQDVVYLSSNEDDSDLQLPLITLSNAADPDALSYSTFGTFARKNIREKQAVSRQHNGPLIVGSKNKNAVNTLIDMSTHTMPPLSLLCHDFIKSLVKLTVSQNAAKDGDSATVTSNSNSKKHKRVRNTTVVNGDTAVNGFVSNSEEEDTDETDNDSDDDNDNDHNHDDGSKVKTNAIENRKKLLKANEQLQRKVAKESTLSAEKKLELIAEQELDLEF